MARRKAANTFTVDLELVNCDEHIATHPKRQIGVEGSDARAKALDRIDRLGRQLDRRGHEICHVIDIDAHQIGQLAHGLGGLQRRDVIGGGCKLVLDLGKRGIGLGQRGLGLTERSAKLRQRAARICKCRCHTRDDTGQVARNGSKRVERARGLRQRVLAQVRLGLAKVGRTGMNCVIDSVTGTRNSRCVIRHGARLRGQTVLDALKLFILLSKQIDGRYNARVNFLGTCRRVIGENLQVPDNGLIVVDRRLKRLERVVDTGGRRCDRARQLADGSVRRGRRLGERKAAFRERLGERGDGVARRGASFAQQIVALGDRLRQRRCLALQAGKCRISRGDSATRLIDGGIHIANRIAHLAQGVGRLGHRTCQRVLSLGCLVL